MPECVYCGETFKKNGHKTHERYCDARAERFQGTPVGYENWCENQTDLTGYMGDSPGPSYLSEHEREALAEQVHDMRRKTTD